MSSVAGRIVYHVYHRRMASVRTCFRNGGPWQQYLTARGRSEMEAAAHRLGPPAVGGAPLQLQLLTGRRFWYQTAFCLHTLAGRTGRPLAPTIFDDGSLGAEHREPLHRLFPLARFVSHAEAVARIDALLPAARFPSLRDRWQHYPNIRKLTDPHLGSTGWKLVIDSDLLFFRRPDVLLRWLDAPEQPFHAIDCETSYGYSRPLLESLAGAPLAELVNVGLCGLRSESLDWDQLEHWCRVLVEREGTHYFLEQALVAMLVAGRDCTVAPASVYVTNPRPPESDDCRAVMHHYVAGSKRWYFQHNWRRAMASGQ